MFRLKLWIIKWAMKDEDVKEWMRTSIKINLKTFGVSMFIRTKASQTRRKWLSRLLTEKMFEPGAGVFEKFPEPESRKSKPIEIKK